MIQNSSVMNILSSISKSGNPMEEITKIFNGNPMLDRAMKMTEGKTQKEIETVAKNLCAQRGIDFEKAVEYMSSIGLNLPR